MSTVVLDSSVWIELLTEGPRLRVCQKEYEQKREIYVPTVIFFEVYKKISALLSEEDALSALTVLRSHKAVDLNEEVALTAADLANHLKLAMADSIVLAHAKILDAKLITLDFDFSKVEGVIILK